MSGLAFDGVRYITITDPQFRRIMDGNLSASEYRLFLAVASEVSGRRTAWFIRGGIDALTETTGLSRAQTFRALARLVELGLLVKHARTVKAGARKGADQTTAYHMPWDPQGPGPQHVRESTRLALDALQARDEDRTGETQLKLVPVDNYGGGVSPVRPGGGLIGETRQGGRTDETPEDPERDEESTRSPMATRIRVTRRQAPVEAPCLPTAHAQELDLRAWSERIVEAVEAAPAPASNVASFRSALGWWKTGFLERCAEKCPETRESAIALALESVGSAVKLTIQRETTRAIVRLWFVHALHRAARPDGWTPGAAWRADVEPPHNMRRAVNPL